MQYWHYQYVRSTGMRNSYARTLCLCRSGAGCARACAPWLARRGGSASYARRRPTCSVLAEPTTVCLRHSPTVFARGMARPESSSAGFVTGPYTPLLEKFVAAGPQNATYLAVVNSLPFIRCALCVLPCTRPAKPRTDSWVTGNGPSCA